MVKPTVSVIIPVFNGAEVVTQAVESMLRQTWQDLEIIVVDDASTDGTADLIRRKFNDSRLHLIEHAINAGAATARNTGIIRSKGEYIAFLDADDLSVPHRIEAQISHLRANPGIGVLGSSVSLFGSDNGVIDVLSTPEEVAASTMFTCEFLMPSLMFRRRTLDDLGDLFRPEYGPNCDWEIIARVCTETRVANLQERLVKYRRWPQQMTARIVDTLDCPATRLRSEMLEWFGIPLEEQDLAAHISAAPCYWPLEVKIGDTVTPQRRDRWLKKVRDTNKKNCKLNQRALENVIERAENWELLLTSCASM